MNVRDDRVARVDGRASCMPTRAMTTPAVAATWPAWDRGADRAARIEDSTRLGRVRWVVERTMSWLLGFRRLALRYDRTESTITALLSLACALICHRRLTQHPPRPA